MDSEKNKMKTSDTTETELNTAIVNEAFAENKVYMLEKQLKQANERIKRLEEMYEGEIGENEQFLGSNLKGLLIREINECNKIIRQQQLLDEENLMLKERIKRLEEVGDVLFENSYPSMWDLPAAADQKLTDQSNWLKAKEAKL